MSSKNKTSTSQSNSRTFFWTSKKSYSNKKKYFPNPKNKTYSEEIDTSSQKENISENIQPQEIEPSYEDEYKGLIYHPPYQAIIQPGIYYIIETEKKEEYNNFKVKWKTEICRYWEMYGECKFGENCAFAHGDSELKKRKLTFNYKTKPCKQFFELGYCTYGSRCQFSHKKESENSEENKEKVNVSYLKIIKELESEENKISYELLERPRLKTFEDIVHSSMEQNKDCKLKLYEDINNLKNENLNLKKDGVKKFKLSEDTNFNSNVNSDNNDNKEE